MEATTQAGTRLPAAASSCLAEMQRERFVLSIATSLIEQPFEDGMSHPCESLLKHALEQSPTAPQWIEQCYRQQADRSPSLAGDFLRCLGRVCSDETAPWAVNLVRHALQHASLQLRDSAVCTLEGWGTPLAEDLLRKRADEEPVDWLADYARQVSRELSERQPA